MFGVMIPLGLNASSDDFIACQDAKTDYTVTKTEWSELYTEESFLNKEFTRLERISRDSKLGLDILHSAEKIFARNGKLTKTEVATLNSRVPDNKGTLFTNGTVLLTGKEIMSIKDALDVVSHVHEWSNSSLREIDKKLKETNTQTEELNYKIEMLENKIKKFCDASSGYHDPQAHFQEVDDRYIAERFAQKEMRREYEVSQRQWNDIEREWLHQYYPRFGCRRCGPPTPVPPVPYRNHR
jgi:chromosome segregation ATPase